LCSGIPAYRVEFEVPLNPKIAMRWHGILLRGDLPQQEIKAHCALSTKIGMDEVMKTSLPYSGIFLISEFSKNTVERNFSCLLSNATLCQVKKGVPNVPAQITTTPLHPFCVFFQKSQPGKGFQRDNALSSFFGSIYPL
jgi:hypothetical protein